MIWLLLFGWTIIPFPVSFITKTENRSNLFSSEKLFAWKMYLRWTVYSHKRKIKEISKVVDMFNNHIAGVVNALLMNLNNAMAEWLNGKIQELKTVGKGYRAFANSRSATLFFHGGLNLYPH